MAGDISTSFLPHQQAVAGAGLCGYRPSPVSVPGSFGIVTVQQQLIVAEAASSNDHIARAHGFAIQHHASHGAVFICMQRGHPASARHVDFAAADLAVQNLCDAGAVARCLVAARDAFHTRGIEFIRIEFHAQTDEPFDRRPRQFAKPPHDRRLQLKLIKRHVIFVHCINAIVFDAGCALNAGRRAIDDAARKRRRPAQLVCGFQQRHTRTCIMRGDGSRHSGTPTADHNDIVIKGHVAFHLRSHRVENSISNSFRPRRTTLGMCESLSGSTKRMSLSRAVISRTAIAISRRASCAPIQWWIPAPKARWEDAFLRSTLKSAGHSNFCSSRLAEP